MFADDVNQAARRRPREQQNWTGGEWGWAWPANRRVLYNRASADPDGRPWSPRKALVWWDSSQGKWVGHDTPDFKADKAPTYVPPEDAEGPEALTGAEPFIMQGDGRGWLYAPAGLADGPMPTHYEPQDSPFENALYGQRANPARKTYPHPHNRYHPSGDERGADMFPYVVTTYRLTEHFTAGGMTRWTPYLAELQPEFFCEVSPELAAERKLEHGGWATIATARGVIEARVLVTDRMTPLRVHGRTVHQIGMPFHWGAERLRQRRLRQRAYFDVAGPERPHPGGQGVHGRHQARASPARTRPPAARRGLQAARRRNRRDGHTPVSPSEPSLLSSVRGHGDPAADVYEEHPPRMGFFTDTSLCIGCKACEVACKEWNQVPEDGLNFTGMSFDNSEGLSADTWRHVAFIEQRKPIADSQANFQHRRDRDRP